jgi:hypothetical protein
MMMYALEKKSYDTLVMPYCTCLSAVMVDLARHSRIKPLPTLIPCRSRRIDRLIPSGYVSAVLLNK